MQIEPVIKNINRQIKLIPKRYYYAGRNGYKRGQEIAQQNNHNSIRRLYDISKGVTKEVVKKSSIDDLPPMAGIVGFCTPIPFASVTMYVLGKIIQVAVNLSRGKFKF